MKSSGDTSVGAVLFSLMRSSVGSGRCHPDLCAPPAISSRSWAFAQRAMRTKSGVDRSDVRTAAMVVAMTQPRARGSSPGSAASAGEQFSR